MKNLFKFIILSTLLFSNLHAIDTDNDTIIDSIDQDDDNDGISDAQELCGTNYTAILQPVPVDINIYIDLDEYEDETTWTLTGPSGFSQSGGPYVDADTIIDLTYTLNVAGTYTFSIADAYGDGLNLNANSDENGQSFYRVTLGGNIIKERLNSPAFILETTTMDVGASSNYSCLTDEPNIDSDLDGLLNYQDPDYAAANGSSIVNGVMASLDTDGDGIINSMDLDSDSDSCSDANEAYKYNNADGGDNEYYSMGNPPATNADGTVSSASYPETTSAVLDSSDSAICAIPTPFTCDSTSYVNYVTSGTFLTGEEHLASIDLAGGTQTSDAMVNGVIGVTSLGYNVQDNYLWGYNMANKKIVRIDANNNSQVHDVAGMIDEIYSGADVSSDGILHLSVHHLYYNSVANTLKIDRIDTTTATPTKLAPLTLNTAIDALDISFNPLDGNIYFIASDGIFYRIVISNGGTTGTVEVVGDTGLGAIYNVISYFDKDGTFYFNTDTTEVYKLTFDATGLTSTSPFSSLTTPLTQGDGARCPNSGVNVVAPDPCDASTSGNTDTDGDNVSDVCDLDDDNDGILDMNEEIGIVTYTSSATSGGTTTITGSTPNGIVVTTSFTSDMVENLIPPQINKYIDNSNFTFLTSNVTSLDAVYGFINKTQITGLSNNLTFNFASPTIYEVYLHVNSIDQFRLDFDDALNPGIGFQLLSSVAGSDTGVAPDFSIGDNDTSDFDQGANPDRLDGYGGGSFDGTIRFFSTNNTGITQLILTMKEDLGVPNGNFNEGWYFALELAMDTDGDGIPNYLDLDSDNDGISDLIESGQNYSTVDTNNNGRLDTTTDNDKDGLMLIVDSDDNNAISTGLVNIIDTDADTISDVIDLDSDNDGIPDAVESKPTVGYVGNDGNVTDEVNSSTGVLLSGLIVPNVDADDGSDTLADYIDTDSDEDGLLDSVESGLTLSGNDINGDGIDDNINASYFDPDGDVNNPLAMLTNVDVDVSDVDYRSLGIAFVPNGKVWYDEDANGLQNENNNSNIEGVKIELYNIDTATIIANTRTNRSGEYFFTETGTLNPITNYEFRIEKLENKYPFSTWEITTLNAGADDSIDSDASLNGIYWTLAFTGATFQNNNDFGFKTTIETGCLTDMRAGISDETIANSHPNSYDFDFSGEHVTGFCAERLNSDPDPGDNYEVHNTDRQGLMVLQKTKLSRLYSAITDPSVLFSIADAFPNHQTRLDDLLRYMTWYYTHYNEDMNAMSSVLIDGNGNYTLEQETAMKDLAIQVSQKVEGTNGYAQYTEQTIFWLWNTSNTSNQDMIVPAIYAKNSTCTGATTPFSCSTDSYMFTGDAANTPVDAYQINLLTGDYNKTADDFYGTNINAIGYNVTDNMIWGYDRGTKKIAKVDSLYDVTEYSITGLIDGDWYMGDVSLAGILHLYTAYNSSIYKVDVNPASGTYLQELSSITLSNSNLDSGDFSFHPIDSMIYLPNEQDGNLYRINPTTGQVDNLGTMNILDASISFNVTFFDKDGNLYVQNNDANKVYKIDLTNVASPNPVASYFSALPGMFYSDGARCANAGVVVESLDYGDAPASYEEGNPASHSVGTLYMGSSIDTESSNQASVDAKGDDNNGDDEDGITFLTNLTQGDNVIVEIDLSNSTQDCKPQFWLDLNQDGDWSDANEALFAWWNVVATAGTTTNTPFFIPDTATLGTTFARFRCSVDGNLSFNGSATNGEVEDYEVEITTDIPTQTYCTDIDTFLDTNSTTIMVNLNEAKNILQETTAAIGGTRKIEVIAGASNAGFITINAGIFAISDNIGATPPKTKVTWDANGSGLNLDLSAEESIYIHVRGDDGGTPDLIHPIELNITDTSGQTASLTKLGYRMAVGADGYYLNYLFSEMSNIANLDLANIDKIEFYSADNDASFGLDFSMDEFKACTSIPPIPPTTTCGLVATSIMPSGDRNDAGNAASVVAFDYNTRGTVATTPALIELASASDVGTVWGKAYDGTNDKLYASAFLRRHADLSPDGLGAIYEIDVASKTPTLWMDLNSITHLGAAATLFPSETAANRGLGTAFAPSHDVWAYNKVGKQGIAGLELSDDFTKMYAVDMTNRQVLEIDTATKTVSNRYPITDPGCAGGLGDIRPFGVDYLNGSVYVGVTCSGETNGFSWEADAHVMKLSAGTFTTVLSGVRGSAWAKAWSSDPYGDASKSCGDNPRMNDYTPIITNMELDENNNMIVGVKGINGFRFANANYPPDATCNVLTNNHESTGYVLQATPSGSSWVLGANELIDPSDPTIKHFYNNGQYAHWGTGASNTFTGGMAVSNCSGQEILIANIMDPLGYEAAGTRYMRTVDGEHETAVNVGDIDLNTSKTSTRELFEGTATTWEKSSGVGDIEILNAPAVATINNIGEFRFDCFKSGQYKDYSSIENNATTTLASTLRSDGILCNAVDGWINSSWLQDITIADNPAYHVDQGSISFWIEEEGTVYTPDPYFSKGNFLVKGRDQGGGATGRVQVESGADILTSNRVYNIGELIFVTVTFEQNGKLKLYLDGVLDGEMDYNAGTFNNLDDLKVATYSGFIDEFYMFDGVMSQTEIQALHQQQLNNLNLDDTARDCSCSGSTITLTPFTCDNTLYLSNDTILGTGSVDTTKTWLHSIDQNATPHSYTSIGGGYANKYNALGYNIQDNFMYALDGANLIKIDSNATVEILGSITGLPIESFYSGEFDRSGNYYLSGTMAASDKLYKIDINTQTIISTITLKDTLGVATSIRFWDMAIDETGNYFYVMLIDAGFNNDTLAKIEISTGIVTPIGTSQSALPYVSLVFSDIEGKLFMMSNQSGFYTVNTTTGTLSSVATTLDLTFNNDGTSCPDANLTEPLIIAIDNAVTKFEGDSGITDFVFTITLSKAAPVDSGFSYSITNGLATVADNDYVAQASNIVLTAGTIEANITVSVNGDTKMEENEDFYVSIFAPLNLSISNAVGVGTILNDDVVYFNVERTNSDTVDNATQDRKEALYTQISGRDFNYAVVTYDSNVSSNLEEKVDDISIKVQLLDMNNSALLLYEDYLYFPSASVTSRLERTLVNDLAIPSAHRDARYRVYYIVDGNGSIVKGQYDNAADYASTKALYFENGNSSRDNFAIRAEKFNMQLLDGSMLRKSSTDGDATPIKLAAGYDYDLNITAVTYGTSTIALDYNTSVTRTLEFKDNPSCNNESNATGSETFMNGENVSSLFEHQNVGLYALNLEDTEWTKVDFNKTITDCIVDDSDSSANGDTMSGCNTVGNTDINIDFYPYQFDVNLKMTNLPNSGHDDFLYMNTLTNSSNNYALQFEGDITAQSADDVNTTNFTVGCAAQSVSLKLTANTLSEDGINQILLTSPSTMRGRTAVQFTRLIRYNNDTNNSLLNINNNLDYITETSSISSNKFLNENNGTVYLDIRYNVNKNLSETINPIQVVFENFDVNSTDANSIANDKVNIISDTHTPTGSETLNSAIRNFYFTQVASDAINYPKIDFTKTSIIRTPLNIDIFCDKNISYCTQTNILSHTDTSSLPRVSQGWYPSIDHNSSTDGEVQSLTPNSVNVTIDVQNLAITPPSGVAAIVAVVSSNTNVRFDEGRNGLIINTFDNCLSINDVVIIDIEPDSMLRYDANSSRNGNPSYTISCRDSAMGSLSGVGNTGRMMENNSSRENVNRLSW